MDRLMDFLPVKKVSAHQRMITHEMSFHVLSLYAEKAHYMGGNKYFDESCTYKQGNDHSK